MIDEIQLFIEKNSPNEKNTKDFKTLTQCSLKDVATTIVACVDIVL